MGFFVVMMHDNSEWPVIMMHCQPDLFSCPSPKFSKCPSGCRLQGLISQMENKVERKLRKVCKTAEMYEDATEKSMTTMTDSHIQL